MKKSAKNFLARRQFLRKAGSYFALAGSTLASSAPMRALAQTTNLRVRSVEAYPIYINERSEGLLESPTFADENDPGRCLLYTSDAADE